MWMMVTHFNQEIERQREGGLCELSSDDYLNVHFFSSICLFAFFLLVRVLICEIEQQNQRANKKRKRKNRSFIFTFKVDLV